jgi:ribosome modulation factor
MAEPARGGPYKEGEDACARGVPRSDCPYPQGSQERVAWLEGWDDASDLNEEGELRDDE